MLVDDLSKWTALALQTTCAGKDPQAQKLANSHPTSYKSTPFRSDGVKPLRVNPRRKVINCLEDDMDSETPSNAYQAATTDSSSEERRQSDHPQDDVDFLNSPSADQTTDTDLNSEDRHIFHLFAIPQHVSVEVKNEVLQFLIFVHSEELFQDDRFYGSYLSIVGGSNGDPDQVVLVETFERERTTDYGCCSDDGEAELGDNLFVELEYYENYWGLIRSLISRRLLDRGRVIDPDLEDGVELMEKLRGRKLWMYGVHL